MPNRKHIRRAAMQFLYQFDLRGEVERAVIEQTDGDRFDKEEVAAEAYALALAAWEDRERADGLIAELAPDWPTYRQPPVDKAILRLAVHEMVSGHAPPKVAINEAVQLAKDYCAEQSPAFVNGVLDKIARKLAAGNEVPDAADDAKSDDAWLTDALSGQADQRQDAN